jgi:MFS family permease
VSARSSEPSVTRVALLLGTLVALTVVGSSAVAVALPQLARDLGLDKPGTAWVLAVFSLAFAITTAVFGRLADLQGLRRPLRIGVVMLGVGSVGAGLAWDFPSLIAARALQGAGAGAVPVLALGVLAARYEGVARGRALGALTAVVSIVSGSGPLIGGGIADLASWRWVLAVPVLAMLVMEPVARLAPAGARAPGRVDWRGAALAAAMTTGVVLILQSPATKPGPILILVAVLLAVGGGVAVAQHVRSNPNGFLPLRVVTNTRVMLSAVAGMTMLAAYLGLMLAVPLLFTEEHGMTPLQIGLTIVPAALVGAVASRIVGGTAQRLGRYRVAAWLSAGSVAGLLVAATAHSSPVLVIVGFAAVVVAVAAGQVALIDGIAALVDEDVQGVALGVFNLIFFTGGAIGAAVIGGVGGASSTPFAIACLAALPLMGAVASVMVDRVGPAVAGPRNAEAGYDAAGDGLHSEA